MVTNYGVNSATNSPSVGANSNRVNPGNSPQIAPTNQIIPQGNPAARQADQVQISPDARRAQGAQSSPNTNATTRTTNRITSQGTGSTTATNRVRVTSDRVQISEEARRAQEEQRAQETPPPPPENPEPTTAVDELTA